jgi:hypothetical protein
MKITVAIPTFNREKTLRRTALSLSLVEGISECNIRVYDNCSSAFNLGLLREMFPSAKSIFIQPHNLGPDFNTSYMFADYLKSGDDLFFNADSDMLYHPHVIRMIQTNFKNSSGVMSMYHSFRHKVWRKKHLGHDSFLLKKKVGTAGCVFSKELLSDIIYNAETTRSFDWDCFHYLAKNKIRIWVPTQSYMQHIGGIDGVSSNEDNFDFALGFLPGNHQNEQLLKDYIKELYVSNLKKKFYKWIVKQERVL